MNKIVVFSISIFLVKSFLFGGIKIKTVSE